MYTMQALQIVGINPFAVTLLAESLLKSPLAPMTVGKPQGFFFPINRGDCQGWSGVRITLEAVPTTLAAVAEVREAETAAADHFPDAGEMVSAQPQGALPDPFGCRFCEHLQCGRFDGPRSVECRAMADGSCARPQPAPEAPTADSFIISERRALTLDQIGSLDAGCGHAALDWDTRVSVVRAVERAHGIGAALAAAQPAQPAQAVLAHPMDSDLVDLLDGLMVTGENQKRASGYAYRSIGEATNVLERDLIEFARRVLKVAAAQAAQDTQRLRGEADVLRGWIREALGPLEACQALDDFEDGGEQMSKLIEAGKALVGEPAAKG